MTNPFPSDAKVLHAIIANNEAWLVERILFYAKRQGYTRYGSTLREAWRQSIAGLSQPLLDALGGDFFDVELGPDENFATDTLSAFGIREAKRHRRRGVKLSMFLGLMKYYRQSYMDLIGQKVPDLARADRFGLILQRVFDRIEIGFVTAWHAPGKKNDRMAELQHANRVVTNEKNKYLTLFESLHLPIAVLDANRHIDMVNHAWTDLFGVAAVPGAVYFDDLRAVHSVAWLSKEVQALLVSDESEKTFEKTVTTTLGDRHVSIKIKRMLDVSEKFSGCMILLDDITQEKKADATLQETTIWLTEMFNALEEAVFLATPTGRIVEANIAAQKIFGYSLAEMKHHTTELLHVDQDHFQAFRIRVRDLLAKGETAVFEYRTKRKNGETFPVMVHVALLNRTDNSPLGIVCVLRDISELKKAEEANRKNERLQGALELAGAVCHDMNQPLMAISGYAELALMESPTDAPCTRNLKKIIDQVHKVGDITKKLMNVTRYETKPYLDQQIIDLEKASGKS